MPILQYFTKNPYDNTVDPDTGLPARPSLWQSLGHPQESRDINRQRLDYQQLAGTPATLAPNPSYDPSGIDPWGSDNPYSAPTARQSVFRPELTKQYQQFQNAPYEQDLARQSYSAMTPAVVSRDVATAKAMIPLQTEQATSTYGALTPLELSRTKQLQKQVEQDKIDQTVSALTQIDSAGFLPAQFKGHKYETIAHLINSNPSMDNIFHQAASAAGIQHQLPELEAAAQELNQKLQAHEAEKKDIGEVAGLGMRPSLARTAQNNIMQQEFASRYGIPASTLGAQRSLFPVGEQGVTEINDPFHQNKLLGSFQDAQAMMGGLNKSTLGTGVEAAGYSKVRPTLGYTGDLAGTGGRLPSGLQQGPSISPAPTNVARPAATTIPGISSPEQKFYRPTSVGRSQSLGELQSNRTAKDRQARAQEIQAKLQKANTGRGTFMTQDEYSNLYNELQQLTK